VGVVITSQELSAVKLLRLHYDHHLNCDDECRFSKSIVGSKPKACLRKAFLCFGGSDGGISRVRMDLCHYAMQLLSVWMCVVQHVTLIGIYRSCWL
jgi:hypothetical protein